MKEKRENYVFYFVRARRFHTFLRVSDSSWITKEELQRGR